MKENSLAVGYFKRFLKEVGIFTGKAFVVVMMIVLFILLMAFVVFKPVLRNIEPNKQFSVSGEAKKFVSPDLAYVVVSAEFSDKNPSTVQKKADEAMNKAKSDIVKLGVEEKDIRTASYDLRPKYSWSNNTQDIIGYTMTIQLEVRLKDFTKINGVIASSVAAGLNRIDGVSFTLSNLNEIKDSLTADAIKDAKQRAEGMAKESGLKLGRLINISDSYTTPYPYYDEIGRSASSYKESTAVDSKGTGTTPSTSITPGQTEIKMNITLYYEID